MSKFNVRQALQNVCKHFMKPELMQAPILESDPSKLPPYDGGGCANCSHNHILPSEEQTIYISGLCKIYILTTNAHSHCFGKHFHDSQNTAQLSMSLDEINFPKSE